MPTAKVRPHKTASGDLSEAPKGQVTIGNAVFGVARRHFSSLLPRWPAAAAPSFKHRWRAVHVVLGNTRRSVFFERLGNDGRCPCVLTSHPVNAVGRSEQPSRGERLAFALLAARRQLGHLFWWPRVEGNVGKRMCVVAAAGLPS